MKALRKFKSGFFEGKNFTLIKKLRMRQVTPKKGKGEEEGEKAAEAMQSIN